MKFFNVIFPIFCNLNLNIIISGKIFLPKMEDDQSNCYINDYIDLVSLSLLNDEEDAKLLLKI